MEAVSNDNFENGWLYNNFTDSLYPEDITPYKNLPHAICYILISLIGLVGNSLVMYIFLRYAKIRTVSNIYIFNLAISDVLLMVALPFLATQAATNNWSFGIFWCKFVMSVKFINPTACISFVMVMSIDRCVVLYRPLLASKWRKPKVASLLCIAVWAFSILSALPVTFFSLLPEENSICFVGSSLYALYTLGYFCLGFLQPVELIVLCLCMTAVKAPPAVPPVNVAKRKGSDRTRMVVMLFVLHMLFWLPLNIFILVQPFLHFEFLIGLHGLFNILAVVNVVAAVKSCVYPIMYWYLGDFRQCFQSVFCCKNKNRSSEVVGYEA